MEAADVIGFVLVCGLLVLVAAWLVYGAVEAAGFWGALAMTCVFAGLMVTVAQNCPA